MSPQPAAPSTDHSSPATHNRVIAVIGLGEVGRAYGSALSAAGHDVRGYDAYLSQDVEGVKVAKTVDEAVAPADIVFVLTAASASRPVAESVVPAIGQGASYADFTSSAPQAKRALQEIFAQRADVDLADVAILGPVIQLGTETPLMAAGPAAQVVADIMTPLGAPVEVVDGQLGDAMAHKLLRSIFMKGLASVVVEAVSAGHEAGMEDWIRDQIARQLAGDGNKTIDRFLSGSKLHAARRSEEMDAAAGYIEQLGLTPTMTQATAQHLRSL